MSSKAARGAWLLFLAVLVSIPAIADRSTSLTVSPAVGTYGGGTSLRAVLRVGNRPISNKTINFTLNGLSVGSATTNSNGVASLGNASLGGIQANTYPNGVKAMFAGDGNFRSSQGTATLTVNR